MHTNSRGTFKAPGPSEHTPPSLANCEATEAPITAPPNTYTSPTTPRGSMSSTHSLTSQSDDSYESESDGEPKCKQPHQQLTLEEGKKTNGLGTQVTLDNGFMTTRHVRKMNDNYARLMGVFPYVPPERLQEVLIMSKGDLGKAIDLLFMDLIQDLQYHQSGAALQSDPEFQEATAIIQQNLNAQTLASAMVRRQNMGGQINPVQQPSNPQISSSCQFTPHVNLHANPDQPGPSTAVSSSKGYY